MELEEKVKRQTINAINYHKNIDNLEEVPIDILRAMYKDLLENSISKDVIREKMYKETNKAVIAEKSPFAIKEK